MTMEECSRADAVINGATPVTLKRLFHFDWMISL
jgi:hypothetical protein